MSRALLACAVSAIALVSSPAWAQDKPTTAAPAEAAAETPVDNGGVGDIIVTAQRRQENAQNVPIAITAISAEQMAQRGISNALQVAQFVPNLTAMNNTGLGSANAYYLRGLGSTETIPTFDPPVGTYVDDIYLSRQNANNLSLFDVQRVEVLRGPQGTLFGRNTTGGAINVIMRDPGKDLGGYVEAGYGRYNKKMARASIDVPLAPTFQIKLSGYWQNDDGYVKNVTTGERLNDDDGWGVRLGIKGELSPDVTFTGSYMHVAANGENILNFVCNPLALTQCDGRYASTGLRQNNATPPYAGLGITGRKSTYGLGTTTDTDLVSSKLDWKIEGLGTLSLIGGYLVQTQQYGLDFFDGRGANSPTIANAFPTATGFPKGGFVFLSDLRSQQFTQEAKLSGTIGDGLIDYVTGVYHIHEDVRTDFADILGTATGAGALVLADRLLRNSTEAIAGYVQGDLNVGPFKATAGVRYTDEKKYLSFRDNRPVCQVSPLPASCLDDANMIVPANGTSVPTAVVIPRALRTKLWTPRFVLNYKPGKDFLLYASATRGFKSGGWNARQTNATQILPFGPEKVWSYEAGIKADFFDHKLRANLTAFQINVSDLQTLSAFVNPSGSLAFITRNFADYRNKGLEAEFTLAPGGGVNLFANIGYSNDKYLLKKNQPAFDIYGIQSVDTQLAGCKAALAAGKIAGGPNTPAGTTLISNCANGIVTAQGGIAEPVRTPDFTVSLGGSYRAPLGSNGWALTPSVAASWRSVMEVATANFTIFSGSVTGANGTFPNNPNSGPLLFGSRSPAEWTVNAGLALTSPEDRIKLSVECTNCFDSAQVQSSLGNYTYLSPPMSWLIRARYNF